MDDSANFIYDMILEIYLLKIRINTKWSDQAIESDYGTFKGSISPIVDLGKYEYKNVNTGEITPEELLTNAYSEELYESEHVRTSTKQ